ncbi:helix-turn-helix domain-containing protein
MTHQELVTQINVNHLSPQCKKLYKHLKTVGSISQMEASLVHKIMALPRRISDLREAGIEINRELKEDATGTRYARYTLAA